MDLNQSKGWRIIVLSVLSFCSILFATNARLAGMGGLSLIFEDDLYKLDIYDFAGIAAGLFENDTISNVIARADGLKEVWQRDSLTYLALGQAIPQRLIDYAPVEAVAFYEVIPQFPLTPCELIYTSSQRKEAYDDWGNLRPLQVWRIYADYSQLSRKYIGDSLEDRVRTPAVSGIYCRPITQNFDYGLSSDLFYGIFNSADNQEKVTLVPIGAGGGVAYNKSPVNLGLNGEYHYLMFDYNETYAGTTHSGGYSGHAASPSFGSSIKLTNFTWVGAVNYKWISLSGKADGNDIGDLKITDYLIKSRVLFTPSLIRLCLFGQYDNKTPIYTSVSGDKWFETVYKSYNFGGSAGVVIGKIMAGLEGLYKSNIADDKEANETYKSSDLTGRFGLEYCLIKDIFIRSGFNYNQSDPDLNQSDDNITFNTIAAGIGINLIKNIRFDLAYNYKFGKLDSDPQEKIFDHLGFLFFKYILRSKE